MKPRTAKDKGRITENLLVDYLILNGFIHAERRRLYGITDRGDIAGVVGWVIEVKSGASLDLSGWLRELAVEMRNDGADWGVVVVRPKGKPDPKDWWAIMPLPQAVDLMDDTV